MNPLEQALQYIQNISKSPTAQKAKKIAMPSSSTPPMQQGQQVANFPGYQEAQARGGFNSPPEQADTGAIMGAIQSFLSGFGKESTSSFRKPGFENVGNVQAAEMTPQPTMQPAPLQTDRPTPQATPISIPRERLAQNISNTWGNDTPMLKELDTYIEGGNQLPGNMEKLLPLALALRETQGGKDLLNPAAMKGPNDGLGDNNVFNIRNDQGAFQNYPDLKTAILGNLQQGGQSGGAVGLLAGTKPSSKGIYEDFRKSNDYKDLFKKWSPTEDRNGSMDEQVANLQFILSKLKQ